MGRPAKHLYGLGRAGQGVASGNGEGNKMGRSETRPYHIQFAECLLVP